jgi:hypothetical protein
MLIILTFRLFRPGIPAVSDRSGHSIDLETEIILKSMTMAKLKDIKTGMLQARIVTCIFHLLVPLDFHYTLPLIIKLHFIPVLYNILDHYLGRYGTQ